MGNLSEIDVLLWDQFYRPSFSRILGLDIEGVPYGDSFLDFINTKHRSQRSEILERLNRYREVCSPTYRYSLFDWRFCRSNDRPLKILDFGCGGGHFSKFIARKFHDDTRVVGYDIAARRVSSCPENLIFSRNWSEVEAFGKFDLVIIFFVLHHMNKQDQARWIEAIRGILANGAEVWILEDTSRNDQICSGGVSFEFEKLYVRNEYWSNEWTFGTRMEIHPDSYLSSMEIEGYFPQSNILTTEFDNNSRAMTRLHPLPFNAFQLRV